MKKLFILMVVALSFTVLSDALWAMGRRAPKRYAAGEYQFPLKHDDKERIYIVHLPPSYRPDKPHAVVLNFHGGASSAEGHVDISQMNFTADENGFIVVYPNGTGPKFAKNLKTWNAGDHCCGSAVRNRVDDVGFVNALLNQVERKFNVDPARIYATGFSNGGIFTYRVACELSHRIAAIAPFAGHLDLQACRAQHPFAVLDIKGKQDKCISYEGGTCGGCLGKKTWACSSAAEHLKKMAKTMECRDTPATSTPHKTATLETFRGCKNGVEVSMLTIEPAGHQWPGGKPVLLESMTGPYVKEPDINQLMWEFFERYPKSLPSE